MSFYRSEPGLFGTVNHYGSDGEFVAESIPGVLPGSALHYAADGSYLGRTDEGVIPGSYVTRDASDNIVASSSERWDGAVNHYDFRNNLVGVSNPDLFSYHTELDSSNRYDSLSDWASRNDCDF